MKKLLLCGCLAVGLLSRAQVNLTNNGILYLYGNTDILFVNGAVTNAASASLTNNGIIYIKGNVTNNQASMSAGTGTWELNGSSAQTVDGTQPLKTHHFVSNNTAGITLSNNVSVSGTHTFSAGLVTTSSTPHYLIYEAGAAYTGEADSRHVNGWVKKIGNTAFTFPVGSATVLRPIAITNLSASSEFNAVYSGATTNTTNLQMPLVDVNPIEYWTLNRVSGGTAQVTLSWNDAKVNFPTYILNDIRAAVYSSGNWTNANGTASGSVSSTGTITSSAMSSFGPLSIGSTSEVVPVMFIEVKAEREPKATRIEWKTADELNHDKYEVQRSRDGRSFVTVATVPSRNVIAVQNYSFTDYAAEPGKTFYRIKSIDIDGFVMYSKTVSVQRPSELSFRLLKNPVVTEIVLQHGGTGTVALPYELINGTGQLVQGGTLSINGAGPVAIPLKNVSSNTYFLLLRHPQQLFILKVAVQ